MTKNELVFIIKYAKEHNVTESYASSQFGFKGIKLAYYKKKYGIEVAKKEPSISKETLMALLKYCMDNNVTEKQAKQHFNIKIKGSLSYLKKKYGLYSPKATTKDTILKIIQYSKAHNVSEKYACNVYGVRYNTLYYFKKKYSIEVNQIGNAQNTARKCRIFNLNDEFFKVPNLTNSYYAGFFAADGNVSKNEKICTISISSKDKSWLENFAKNIKYEGTILNSLSHKKFECVTLSFTSEKTAKYLKENYNITPQKSLTLNPPNIYEENLIDSFICGYIDGDGCVCLRKSKRTQDILLISVCGTKQMCEWIKKRFCYIVGYECGTLHKKNNIYVYSISNKCARIIFEHYYNIKIPKLDRKWRISIHNYCITYKKKNPICRRKGVYLYDLNGNFLQFCEKLEDACKVTKTAIETISKLCRLSSNRYQSNGYMFSREYKVMQPYIISKTMSKKITKRDGVIVYIG